MSEQTRRERWDANDAAQAEATWGMTYMPEDPPYDPATLARDAAQRGDAWFQADVVTAAYQGTFSYARSLSRIMRAPVYDYVGAVEREGWTFHSMSSCFVQRGGHEGPYDHQITNGDVVVTYLFRRA